MVYLIIVVSEDGDRVKPYHTVFKSCEKANRICNELNEKRCCLLDGESYKVIGLCIE